MTNEMPTPRWEAIGRAMPCSQCLDDPCSCVGGTGRAGYVAYKADLEANMAQLRAISQAQFAVCAAAVAYRLAVRNDQPLSKILGLLYDLDAAVTAYEALGVEP